MTIVGVLFVRWCLDGREIIDHAHSYSTLAHSCNIREIRFCSFVKVFLKNSSNTVVTSHSSHQGPSLVNKNRFHASIPTLGSSPECRSPATNQEVSHTTPQHMMCESSVTALDHRYYSSLSYSIYDWTPHATNTHSTTWKGDYYLKASN